MCHLDNSRLPSSGSRLDDRTRRHRGERSKEHLGVAKAFSWDAALPGGRRYVSKGTPMLADRRPRFASLRTPVDDGA
jgi:hypothetical protein